MVLCKERYTWNRREKERHEKNTKKSSQRVFFLMFRLNRKLCIFLCTKCTDAMHSSFLHSSRSYTHKQLQLNEKKSMKECFRVLSFVCTTEWDGDVISHENVVGIGKWTRSWKWFERVAMSVGAPTTRENVCADYINLCNLQLLHREAKPKRRRK